MNQEFRKEHGEPDVIEIRQTFNDSLQARLWEKKVIRRLDAVKSIRWLNKIEPGKKFYCDCHTEESKEKMRKKARKQVENGTHHLLGGEFQRESNKKRVESGTHNFLGGEIQRESNRKRVENGTHNLQGKGMMTALNLETGKVSRITKELYYSRRDIYFHNRSKVFKEWKANNKEELKMTWNQ